MLLLPERGLCSSGTNESPTCALACTAWPEIPRGDCKLAVKATRVAIRPTTPPQTLLCCLLFPSESSVSVPRCARHRTSESTPNHSTERPATLGKGEVSCWWVEMRTNTRLGTPRCRSGRISLPIGSVTDTSTHLYCAPLRPSKKLGTQTHGQIRHFQVTQGRLENLKGSFRNVPPHVSQVNPAASSVL